MNSKVLRQFLSDHWGKVVGGLIGLIIGLSIILFGFWRSVLLFTCIALGIYLGRMFDRHEGLQNFLQRVWPDSD
ncbi:DUF2273 domain-containing protein [Dethiobacter alkaliphilus]|uniref:Small integral membrane protein n=1 Tax=Dethiobacter alkaliphilus AHT 1 TaxID=555088 RepID=C0GE33_DETAL|nr:DUF2273 domain-containing protein [Dethiobacter alkaliphilus]EEG78327.1 conserved hypothetical protein [Dethiobacter alkaliphilus AHT 1]